MESRREEGGGPVWLPMEAVSFADGGSSSSTHDETGLLRRGSYQGRPVFVQALLLTTSSGGSGDDSSWAHLQAVSKANKGMASILGFTKREHDDKVYVVMDASEPLVVLRDLLLDKDSDVSWKERAQFAEDITSSLLLTTPELQDQLAAHVLVDANHVLVHKQERRAQLAGLRCSGEAGKEGANEVSAALGLLLVELITRQPPMRAQGRDSLVTFPDTTSSSLSSASSGIRLSVPMTGHQRSRSIGNANSLRSSSSGVNLASSPSGSSSPSASSSSGVHLSPRGSSSSGLDLSSSGSYARRGGLFSSDELKERKKDALAKESNWELVQVKAFTAWLNGYLARRGLKITNLQTDLQDGTLLNHFLEVVNSAKMRRWTAKPNSKITKLENLSIGLAYIQKDMAIKLVGIGAEDIYNGYLKLILGLVWSLFRGLQMRRLAAGGGGSMEEGLMKWVREQTQSIMDVPPSDFKYGFRDGQVFAALISRFDSSLVDLGAIKDKSPEEVLPLVFEIAEKHVGVPRLLEVTDLLSDDPDERAIQLYVSLFFDAFSLRKETAEFDSIIEITPPPPVAGAGGDESNSEAGGQATSDPITIPADCPMELVELAKECCRTRADERPTLAEVNQRLHALVAEITQREEVAQKKEADEAERRDEVGRLKRLLSEKEVEIEALKGQLESNNHKKESAVREEEEESEAGAAKRKSEEAEASRREKEESEEAFEAKEEEVLKLKEVLHDAMEKVKEERREKQELSERLTESEQIATKSEEERRSLVSERDRLAERLEKQERAESEMREALAMEKEAHKIREEELEGRVKEAEERIRSQREELLEQLREEEEEAKKNRESKALEEAIRKKHDEDELMREKERQHEEEVKRIREEMSEALEKAKAELRKEMEEEIERAREVERQRWETERRETLEKEEEEKMNQRVDDADEMKRASGQTDDGEMERLREQLSEALIGRDEQAKEMELLATMLKERERQLDISHEELTRVRTELREELEQAKARSIQEKEEMEERIRAAELEADARAELGRRLPTTDEDDKERAKATNITENEEASSQRDDEITEVQRLRDELSEALGGRDEQAKEIEQLGSTLKERERQLDVVREEEARERSKWQQTITANGELQEENQRLREALAQTQNDADQVRVERAEEEHQHHIDSLQAQTNDALQRAATLEEAAQDDKEKRVQLQSQIDNLHEVIARNEAALAEKESELHSLLADKQRLLAEAEQQQQQSAPATDALMEKESELQTLKADSEAREAERNAEVAELRELVSKKEEHDQKAIEERAMERLAEKEAELAAARAEVAQVRAHSVELERAAATAAEEHRQQIDSLQAQTNDARLRAEEAAQAEDKEKEKRAEAQSQIDNLREVIARNEAALAEKESELRSVLDDKQRLLEEAQRRLHQEQERALATDLAAEKEAELARMGAQIAQLEEACAQTTSKWEARAGELERTMAAEAEAHQIETDALRRENAALKAQAAGALERAAMAEAALEPEKNATATETRQAEIGEAEELAQLRGQVESLRDSIKRHEGEAAREREAAQQTCETVETWRARAEAAELRASEHKHALNVCEQLRHADGNRAQVDAEEREEWQRRRAKLEATIARLQLDLGAGDAASEVERVQTELEAAAHDNDALRQRVAELEATTERINAIGNPKEEDELMSQIRAISRVKRQLQMDELSKEDDEDGKAEAKRRARQRARARRRGVARACTHLLWTLLFVLVVAMAVLLLRIDFVKPWRVPT